MTSHEVEYRILGDDMQLVEITLDPGETVIAEAGAMNYMDDHIGYRAKMGDGSEPDGGFFNTLWNMGKRALTGESLFITHFTNEGEGRRVVAFAAPYPGKIIALDLSTVERAITCQQDAFLAAALGTKLDVALNTRLGSGLFGGEGFILQRLKGDGLAFLHAGGTVIKRELQGETIKVDTGCLVAFTAGIDYDIARAGGLGSMLFGGEGLFLATLRGHGTVWLQSLPFSRLADRILANAPSRGGAREGEGSLVSGMTDFLEPKR